MAHYYPMPSCSNQNMVASTLVYIMQDGQIVAQSDSTSVGVTKKVYDELRADYDSVKKTCQQYYDKLVELGVIVPAPTQEDIMKKQAEQLVQSNAVLEKMNANQERLLGIIDNLTKKLETRDEHSANNSETSSRIITTVA